jgi:hypothetical protein
MSGNINDTDVYKLKDEITNFAYDLVEMIKGGENPVDNKFLLENKYSYLHKTSKTLFDFILNKYASGNVNVEVMNKTITYMLNSIVSIQNGEISKTKASEQVGSMLADEYIPEYIRDRENEKKISESNYLEQVETENDNNDNTINDSSKKINEV